MSKNKSKTIIIICVVLLIWGMITANDNQRREELTTQANDSTSTEMRIEELSNEIAEKQLELEYRQKVKEGLELIRKGEQIVEENKDPKDSDLVFISKAIDKVELPKKEPVVIVEDDPTELPPIITTKTSERSFKMNNGSYKKGSEIIAYTKANPNGLKLWTAFYNKYGAEIADKASISLHFENGTLKPDSVGVCSEKYMIGGDYRNCNYADYNSAGMDAGLKQINTYYQRYKIAKLGGPDCTPKNSRDRTDPCTASQIKWLHNVDNNIKISLYIYEEQGFAPWYGARRAGIT